MGDLRCRLHGKLGAIKSRQVLQAWLLALRHVHVPREQTVFRA
jgi:hypothetical protein